MSISMLQAPAMIKMANTSLVARFAMASLGPTGTTTKTQVPNALHFRRAIQEIRVR